MDLFEAIRTTRAVRRFTDEPVSDEEIAACLAAAVHGPSGGNIQPWQFVVVRDRATRRALGEVYCCVQTTADAERVQALGAAPERVVVTGSLKVEAPVDESAREQATGLREINSAVNEMDQGTQQNAAIVEESSAASHSLASELASLLQQLRQFDIGAPASRPVANVQRPAAVRPVRQASNAVRAELPAHTHDPGWAEF